MGIAEGGITFRSYYVDGELPPGFRDHYVERVRLNRFEPLTEYDEEDIKYGWVPVYDILSEHIHTADIYFQQYLVLGLRMDRWAIPATLLKALVKTAEHEKRLELDRKHLSRLERAEIVDRERLKLKKQTLPAVRLLDFAWNLDDQVVRFSSLSNTANELFADLFERTFQLRLVHDNPYISALNCKLDDDLVGELAVVEPSSLILG